MSDDIVERLRSLARCEHSDLSIGDEAAAEIERLRATLDEADKTLLAVWRAAQIEAPLWIELEIAAAVKRREARSALSPAQPEPGAGRKG